MTPIKNTCKFLILATMASCAISGITPEEGLLNYSEVAGSLIQETHSSETSPEQIDHKASELFQLSSSAVTALKGKRPECTKALEIIEKEQADVRQLDVKSLARLSLMMDGNSGIPLSCKEFKKIVIAPQKIRILVKNGGVKKETLLAIREETAELISFLRSL